MCSLVQMEMLLQVAPSLLRPQTRTQGPRQVRGQGPHQGPHEAHGPLSLSSSAHHTVTGFGGGFIKLQDQKIPGSCSSAQGDTTADKAGKNCNHGLLCVIL